MTAKLLHDRARAKRWGETVSEIDPHSLEEVAELLDDTVQGLSWLPFKRNGGRVYMNGKAQLDDAVELNEAAMLGVRKHIVGDLVWAETGEPLQIAIRGPVIVFDEEPSWGWSGGGA